MKSRAYTNGKIITMDPQYRDPAALLIREGRIAVVGTVERVLNAADAETVWFDLDGKALLPGFNYAAIIKKQGIRLWPRHERL